MLRRRATPKQVTLSDGTNFVARYERISRKQLLMNIRVKNTRKIGPRNRRKPAKVTKKKVRFNPSTALRERLERMTTTVRAAERVKRKYRRQRQTGSGLASKLAKIGFTMGSKALNSVIRKKIINKGIDNIPNMFKYGVSKIKNKNVKRALNSDIANLVVEEAQNKVRKTSGSLFD